MTDRSLADRPAAAAIIVAGGSGTRAALGTPKQYAPYRGTTVLGFAVAAMRAATEGPILAVIPDGQEEQARTAIGDCAGVCFVTGGLTRQLSVRAGLEAMGAGTAPEAVLIHDAARPDLPPSVAQRLIGALGHAAAGAIPVLPVADSIVRAEAGMMNAQVSRNSLRRVQTPQAFRFEAIFAAHRSWPDEPVAADDAQVLKAAGHAVALVDGDARLHKLTFAEDFVASSPLSRSAPVLVGTGFDVHRLVAGDGVRLCGIAIAHDRSLAGHSDADVALHALTDAVLGAVGAGDIGDHFPPSDPRWKGAASRLFLAHALAVAGRRDYRLGNADLTIICEEPKIGPYRQAMRDSLANITGTDVSRLSVKATTTEGLGFTGRGEGIAAQAAVTMIHDPASRLHAGENT